jgi:hypothetical protein
MGNIVAEMGAQMIILGDFHALDSHTPIGASNQIECAG